MRSSTSVVSKGHKFIKLKNNITTFLSYNLQNLFVAVRCDFPVRLSFFLGSAQPPHPFVFQTYRRRTGWNLSAAPNPPKATNIPASSESSITALQRSGAELYVPPFSNRPARSSTSRTASTPSWNWRNTPKCYSPSRWNSSKLYLFLTFLSHSPLYVTQALLQKVTNVDLLLSIATLVPDDPQKCSYRQLNYILLLNTVLDLIAPLKEVLSRSTHPLFVRLTETLSSEEFSAIREIVRDIINDGAHPAKGQAAIMQRCFAIKPGLNGLLDLVRKTYSERLDDMRGRGVVANNFPVFFKVLLNLFYFILFFKND